MHHSGAGRVLCAGKVVTAHQRGAGACAKRSIPPFARERRSRHHVSTDERASAMEVLDELAKVLSATDVQDANSAQYPAFRSAFVRQAGHSYSTSRAAARRPIWRWPARCSRPPAEGGMRDGSTPKRGLGRGLGALLGDRAGSDVSGVAPSLETLMPRFRSGVLRPTRISRAKTSIAAALRRTAKRRLPSSACWVPIIVRRRGERLRVGRRRAPLACLRGVAASDDPRDRACRGDDRKTLGSLAIIENLQRENLNPLEEAAGFQYLHRRVRLHAGRSSRDGLEKAARRSPTRCACSRLPDAD